MSTKVRQHHLLALALLLAGCAQDHYLNGNANFRAGTDNDPVTTPTPTATTYVYATQDTALQLTNSQDGNWIPYANVRANVNNRFSNGIFTSPKGGLYAVTMRVAIPAPGTWAATDYAYAYIAKSDQTDAASKWVNAGAGSIGALSVEVSATVGLLKGQAIRFGVITTRNIATFQQPNNSATNVSIVSIYEVP